MKRGILTLNLDELLVFIPKIDLQKLDGQPLRNKLEYALEKKMDPTNLELSEDELEYILDELGIPEISEPIELNSARGKMSKMLIDFRSLE